MAEHYSGIDNTCIIITRFQKESKGVKMEYANIRVEKNGFTGILTINHPPANAINVATLEDINKALDEFETDRGIRAIIITGSGEKAFCAGFDVTDAARADIALQTGQGTWTRLDRISKPTIAAINGFALGGGCELALACHFRIMSDSPKASIGLTELNLGIIPGWGGTVRMAKLLGRSKALDLILFSKKLKASEALEIGLVDKASADVMKDALELADRISERPPVAVAAVLKAMDGLSYNGLNEGLKLEKDGVKASGRSADAREGFAAFFEKRKPVFKGE
jgi:enoyl-CoA hydratase/carnithine racemase